MLRFRCGRRSAFRLPTYSPRLSNLCLFRCGLQASLPRKSKISPSGMTFHLLQTHACSSLQMLKKRTFSLITCMEALTAHSFMRMFGSPQPEYVWLVAVPSPIEPVTFPFSYCAVTTSGHEWYRACSRHIGIPRNYGHFAAKWSCCDQLLSVRSDHLLLLRGDR